MRASVRSGSASRSTMRSSTRSSALPAARSQQPSAASSLSVSTRLERVRAASPAETVASSALSAGAKRNKERDYAPSVSSSLVEETNINVVVRCRGRNQREVKENSTVVVKTEGVKGKAVGLSMGPSALNNKTYSFDRVFSQAADQSMIYDETVKPILEDMLAGFNCTIFAYGQTGTGKTYTMSGDMTETLGMLSDEAGIIPRVLQQLFNKLELEDTEHCLKVSFIELYNEELRDLLSIEESAKLKIFDDVSKRGHAATVVQGMEEKHIKNAAEGIKVLQDGSLKRQVAATKCNDLSSRSHTVFTVTAYVKKTNDQGVEDFVSAGKLNLVDLAGSENIQRSGAENKRAAEAGLINKSLLTLGRVINALVDRGSHIPYRESKLTRLLQDSLGGRTKTCIIATISPAKSNMEETISTLEYAFRAKNIKNKPQLNPMLNKKMLLKDFANEIEQLKSELITHRQRSGVYLPNDLYEEMKAQGESSRIVMEEQGAKIETLETNLRNKVQELFSLTTTFMGVKKDHEGTRLQLDVTKGILDQTEIVLSATRKTLAEETHIRKAHEQTEEKLTEIGGQLISKLHRTVGDVTGLHAKNKRKSDLQSLNRATWNTSQCQVADVTSMVERRITEFQDEQQEHIASVSRRMGDFVDEELKKLSTTQTFLDEQLSAFSTSKGQLLSQRQQSKDEMDQVLDEIKDIRDSVKERVGESLQAISQAAEKIAADVVTEMTEFHSQLHTSYSSLGKDFKSIFEDLVKHITAQRSESDTLRRQLEGAAANSILQTSTISMQVQEAIDDERRQSAEDRQKLLSQITSLVNSHAEAQENRLAEKTVKIQKSIGESNTSLEGAASQFGQGMDAWDEKEGQLLDKVKESRDQLKTKLKDDWNIVNEQSTAIQNCTKSVHAETTRVVEEQTEDLDTQMEALDDFVTRAKTENGSQHTVHAQGVLAMSNTVDRSFSNIGAHFKSTFDRVKNLGDGMELDANDMKESLEPLDLQLCQPLSNLRESVTGTNILEYQPTGETPRKTAYEYPKKLPRTVPHDLLISRIDEESSFGETYADGQTVAFDKDIELENTAVFADLTYPRTSSPVKDDTVLTGLREVNPNTTANFQNAGNLTTGALNFDLETDHTVATDYSLPLFKKSTRKTRGLKRPAAGGLGEGRENMMMPPPVAGTKRKSPKMN